MPQATDGGGEVGSGARLRLDERQPPGALISSLLGSDGSGGGGSCDGRDGGTLSAEQSSQVHKRARQDSDGGSSVTSRAEDELRGEVPKPGASAT
eukprot:15438720-Alexandrium_andersonii.AAC.1